jgi:hypothetical protein
MLVGMETTESQRFEAQTDGNRGYVVYDHDRQQVAISTAQTLAAAERIADRMNQRAAKADAPMYAGWDRWDAL